MPNRLFLLLCLTGHVFANKAPDVNCLVVHMQYVHCSWDQQGTPQINYTFYSWFHNKNVMECLTYLSENNTNIGCNQTYEDHNLKLNRFISFYTKLEHGNESFQQTHELKNKVKLNPPTNVTAQIGYDRNLWLNWTQIFPTCVESEIRYRVNNRKWSYSQISINMQNYCINLPSRSSLYEMQVRSKIGNICGPSLYWSDWSKPVVWGSNNSTDANKMNSSMSVWIPVLYVVGAFVLILLVMMLLHYERIKIIFIPVVPKPSPKLHNIEDWFQFPKGLKESINYNELPCTVREYCHVSQSDSESSDCSTCSVITDQTDCSVFIPVNDSDPSTPCSSSISSEQEEQVSV